jgi:hypothetical protein
MACRVVLVCEFLCSLNRERFFNSYASMNEKMIQLIEKADLDLAERVHEEECPHCGGRLDWANYKRSPRGLDLKSIRYSLCCAKDGCRRRQTPESVRFLGRKVYAGVIVVLFSAMQNGLSEPRVAELRKSLSVSRATLKRWRSWWLKEFVHTCFWKAARARFMPVVCESVLPASLCERFGVDQDVGLLNLMRFIGPLTTDSQGSESGNLRGA